MTEPVLFMIDVYEASATEPTAGWAATVHCQQPGALTLSVTDLGAARGDGVFETLGVVERHPQAVDAHIARLANSAALLDLPAPHNDQWRTAVAVAAQEIPPDFQGSLKLVLTRGVEARGVPTAWVVASVLPQDFAVRHRGVRVAVLERGLSIDVARRAPWLLFGAKTLSYATNMAALREAVKRGQDDAIFVSTEGYVMEAPTASVVVRLGNTFVTPRTDIGILPGTSQLSLFDFFRCEGFTAEEGLVTLKQLRAADGVWLVSSVRLAAAVTHIDGVSLSVDPEMTSRMNAALLARQD